MWTTGQRQAIDHRGTNLLVAAGAGAGKTAVLVERIIARLIDPLDPIDLDRFLVVTFTNAAATEMRSRIGEALSKLARQNPAEPALRRQQLLLNNASISTLHSFCLEILRQHYYRLELDPGFKIADEIEAGILKNDALEAVLERYYDEADVRFINLVDGFGGRHEDAGLGKLIMTLSEFSLSQAKPEEWLGGLSKIYELESRSQSFAHQLWYGELRRSIEERLSEAIDNLKEAALYAALTGGPAVYSNHLASEQYNLTFVRNKLPDLAWDELREKVQNIEFNRLPAAKNVIQALKDKTSDLRNRSKDIVKKELMAGLLAQSEAEVRTSLHLGRGLVETLQELVVQFQKEYQKGKRAKNLLDFSDLEHMALAVLQQEGSLVARDLQQHFKEVLVDEYQDINGVQEKILSLVSNGANLVMVGDVKQSIYRFRLAEPRLFLQKYFDYATFSPLGQRIHLSHNFRSRPHVIDGVNFIFSRLMSQTIGEIDYDEGAALISSATYPPLSPSPSVELLFLDKSDDAVVENNSDLELDTPTKEAMAIGRQIMEMVQSGQTLVWDKGLGILRPLSYRDIVILLRATKSWGGVFAEVFRQMSIPAYVDVGTGYFATTEISVMLSLLKVIDNPEQDIPMAAVLRSPVVGLMGDDLANIRADAPDMTFWAAIVRASEKGDACAKKLTSFRQSLDGWRKMAVRAGLPELISRLFRETGYYNYVGAMPSGAQRQANLRALYDRACQYESTSFKGLFRFLRFIERLQEEEKDMGQAPALAENEDVVRVMSIHKSKGLEFPAVFVAGLGRKFNMTDFNESLLIHRDLGLGMRVVDLETRCKYPTVVFHALKHRLKNEVLSEEMRILYVALTRAKEKLILVGSAAKLPEKMLDWRMRMPLNGAQLPAWQVSAGSCFLDWVGSACFGHPSMQSDCLDPAFTLKEPGEVADAAEQGDESESLLEFVRQGLSIPEQGYRDEVAYRLAWSYPHALATTTRIKTSVTELVSTKAPQVRSIVPPLKKSGLTSAEVGSALHMVMRHVDLEKAVTFESVLSQLEDMFSRQLLTKEERESVDIDLIIGFFASPLGKRLLAADEVWRELPFGLQVAANEIHPGVENEHIYVQGVIDCLFREGESLFMVDFKSDRVTEESKGPLVDRYKEQVALYAKAVKIITGRRVEEQYLYFFKLGEAVVLGLGEREHEKAYP